MVLRRAKIISHITTLAMTACFANMLLLEHMASLEYIQDPNLVTGINHQAPRTTASIRSSANIAESYSLMDNVHVLRPRGEEYKRRELKTAPTASPEQSANSSSISSSPMVAVMNSHPIRFIINESRACSRSRYDVYVLVFVHTAPGHRDKRMAIRETWGAPSLFSELRTITLFVMGWTMDARLQEAVRFESSQYHDIIQEDFIDSYKNLTLKAIGWLKWTRDYCLQARYILKTDDDIFTNIFHLVSHLRSLERHKAAPARSLVCLVWHRMRVYRGGKWGVPKEDFPGDVYPRYCSGSAYMLTSDIVSDMYNASQRVKFFWVDDVYITGLLPKALGTVRHVSLKSIYVLHRKDFQLRFFGRAGKNSGTGVFAHTMGKASMFYELWDKVLDRMDRKNTRTQLELLMLKTNQTAAANSSSS